MPASDQLTLQSERLLLRRFTCADAAVFFRLNSEPELVQYTGRTTLTSVAEALARLGSEQFRRDESTGLGRFACIEKSTDRVRWRCAYRTYGF